MSSATPATSSAPGSDAFAPEATATIGAEGFVVTVDTGSHRFESDARVESGGRGAAPNPFRLLLGSLGSCTAMTIRMYADRKGWPLEGVSVAMSHDRRRAEPAEAGATPAGWVFSIDARIELHGDGLDATQRQRLLEIGQKCPVHQALASQVRISQTEVCAGDA